MAKLNRILLVEDIPASRESYLAFLTEAGYAVTAVSCAEEAIAAADAVTFHLALVDIMLGGERNTSNRDGVEVIRYLSGLNEGTQTIPLTGQDKRSFVRDAFKELSVFDFLDKKEDIADKGWQYAVGIIEKAIAECEIDDTPNWSDLTGPLLANGEEQGFVHMVSQRIPGAKLDVLQQQLPNCVRNLQPIKARLTDEMRFHWDDQRDAIIGEFWSKAVGKKVKIFLSGAELDPENIGGRTVWSRRKGKLNISAFVFEDGTRGDYL